MMQRYGHGWFRESYRHSLAAKGIKTSFSRKSFLVREMVRGAYEQRAHGEAKRMMKMGLIEPPKEVSAMPLTPEEKKRAEEIKMELRVMPEDLQMAQLRSFIINKFGHPPPVRPGAAPAMAKVLWERWEDYYKDISDYFADEKNIYARDLIKGYKKGSEVKFSDLVVAALGDEKSLMAWRAKETPPTITIRPVKVTTHPVAEEMTDGEKVELVAAEMIKEEEEDKKIEEAKKAEEAKAGEKKEDSDFVPL